MSLFFITVPENQYKLIYCIPNEIANSVDRSGNLNRLFSEVSQDFQSFCSTVFFEAWDRHVRSCTSFWQFSNSVYHFLKYCTLTASSPYLYQLAVNFMGEVFATRRNQIAIRTASVDQVTSFVIVHQLIPPPWMPSISLLSTSVTYYACYKWYVLLKKEKLTKPNVTGWGTLLIEHDSHDVNKLFNFM